MTSMTVRSRGMRKVKVVYLYGAQLTFAMSFPPEPRPHNLIHSDIEITNISKLPTVSELIMMKWP